MGGWALLRVAMLWSDGATLPEAVRGVVPLPEIARGAPTVASPPPVRRITGTAGLRPHVVWPVKVSPPPIASFVPDPRRVELALLAMVRFGPVVVVDPAPQAIAGVLPTRFALSPANRWSASGWIVARGGGGLGAAPGSQLGGSQAGIRVDRGIGGGFAVTGRLATPLGGRGREAALGIAWQGRSPVRIVAEQRIAIDGGRGGPALGFSTGVSDVALPVRFRLEAYGQAGAIARGGVEGYGDGAVRVVRPIGTTLDIGIGAWGAAQRDAARLDIGPTAALRLPLATGGARLSLDWRQRIAGDARPGSGAALTIGADF